MELVADSEPKVLSRVVQRKGEPLPQRREAKDARKTYRQKVSRNLRRVRLLIDGNRARLAEKYGVDHTVWQKWEDGRNLPEPEVLERFCDEHGVTMDWI